MNIMIQNGMKLGRELAPILELAETNKREKSATFKIATNEIMNRFGGMVLRVDGVDLKAWNDNKTVLLGHTPNMPLGMGMWAKNVGGEYLLSKWGPPDIATDGMPDSQKRMVDLAHEIWSWVDAGQLKGASPGVSLLDIYWGRDESERAYGEDFGKKPKRPIWCYIRTSEMFEWSITPIPEQRSALKLQASDMMLEQLEAERQRNLIYEVEELKLKIEFLTNKDKETLSEPVVDIPGDAETLMDDAPKAGDVAEMVKLTKQQYLDFQRFKIRKLIQKQLDYKKGLV